MKNWSYKNSPFLSQTGAVSATSYKMYDTVEKKKVQVRAGGTGQIQRKNMLEKYADRQSLNLQAG
jgi:hypothetical protein